MKPLLALQLLGLLVRNAIRAGQQRKRKAFFSPSLSLIPDGDTELDPPGALQHRGPKTWGPKAQGVPVREKTPKEESIISNKPIFLHISKVMPTPGST